MALVYAAADLCLCRAGASTVAELCALGKPSILVPFPFAANDHQRWNAEALVATGGAHMLLDSKLNGADLAEIVRSFIRDRGLMEAMGQRAKALATPDATSRLADLVVESAHLPRPLARTGNSPRLTVNCSQSTVNRQPFTVNRSG